VSTKRVVYGQNPVRELIAARSAAVSVVYLAAGDAGPALKQLRELCAQRRVAWEEREREELDGLSGEPGARHQGAVAITGEFEYVELEDVLESVAGRAALLVVLDGVQDPHNFGAIVRSAQVMGADAVVVAKDRAAPVTPVVVKASAGATEHLPIARVTNIVRAIEQLKEANVWSVGAVAAADAQAPWQLDLTGSIALVMGAEGKGLRPLVEKTCDLKVRIPMAGKVASLNVSVATGALLYEVARQRASGKK
jgi:23S rRNA (guanosine2251-2'-O)-methyltransferase